MSLHLRSNLIMAPNGLNKLVCREWQKDITLKIKLRDEAIAALPEELRAAAREPDFEPFPANRPIPGFQEQQETATAAKFAKGSRRR